MKNNIIGALALITCSTFANADWVGSINYSNFSSDIFQNTELDLGTIGATVGYRFDVTERFKLLPELRVGFGVNDDSTTSLINVDSADLKLDDYVGIAVRGEYLATDNVYLFAVVSNQNIEIAFDSLVVDGQRLSNIAGPSISETEFGVGAGFGWQFNDNNAVELSYEDIDDSDVITVGYRFNF
jgi:opacity protein-like surface antigen